MRPGVLVALALLTRATAVRADEPRAPLPAPRIAFDREEHDFGVVGQEQEVRTEFTVTNRGGGTLRLKAVRADCGCAVAEVADRELGPGESVPMAVLFRTMTFAGPHTKRVRVWSDDPERPTADVVLRIDVSAGVVLMPPRLAFGDVLRGTTPTAAVTARWKEGIGRPFRVVRVDPSGLDLDLATEPFAAPPWRGTRVVARFRNPPALGPISDRLVLETDHPDHPRLVVPVTGYVSGKVWTSLRAVRLGLVPVGRERSVPVVVRGFSPDVDLGEVSAVARRGRVEAKAVPTTGRAGEWTLLVGVGPTAKPGRVDDVVEVRTAVAGEAPTEIPVSGEILGKDR
jgi:hypothetical protein